MQADNERQVRGRMAGDRDSAFPVVAAADGQAPSFKKVIGEFGRVIGILLATAVIAHVIVILLTVT